MINTENYQNTKAYDLLNEIIEKEISNLKSYANRPDSKESVINIRNAHIKELLEVLKVQKPFKFHEIWHDFEKSFEENLKNDPNINGFILVVKSTSEKENPLHFTYQLGEKYD